MVGLGVLVLGACGPEDSGSGASRERPALPSFSPAGAAAQGSSTMAMEGSAAPLVARDMSYPARPVEYRLAGGVEAGRSTAPAYRIEPGERPDDAAMRRIAEALGMQGTPVEEDGQLVLRDGAAERRLTFPVPGQGWSYDSGSLGSLDKVTSSVGSAVCRPDGTCEETSSSAPPPPPPPALPDLPSKDEARAIALRFAERIGLDATAREVGGEPSYGWTVVLTPDVGGLPVRGMETYVVIGSRGAIVNGSGAFMTVEKVADYPLASVADAFERSGLADGGGWVGIAGGGREPAIAVDSGAPMTATDAPEPAPAPDQPPTTAAPEVVELTAVRMVLVPAYPACPGQTMYLVPGYELTAGADRVVGPIPAVEDADLQQPPPADASSAAADDSDAMVKADACGRPVPVPAEGKEGESVPGAEPADPVAPGPATTEP